jgi:hypothetical protein
MAQTPIYEIDVDGTIRTDALHWEGFPRILWETLSEVGKLRRRYTRWSLFGTRVFPTPARPLPCFPTLSTGVGGLEVDVLCSPWCRVS